MAMVESVHYVEGGPGQVKVYLATEGGGGEVQEAKQFSKTGKLVRFEHNKRKNCVRKKWKMTLKKDGHQLLKD